MPLSSYFTNFKTRPGLDEDALRDLREVCAALGLATLPDDYLSALSFTDGGEGFIGGAFLRLYCLAFVRDLNPAYQVERFAPGLVIFATDGGGEAYAFDVRATPPQIVQVPLIPLDLKYAKPMGRTFTAFLDHLIADHPVETPPTINPMLLGVEVHYIKPIIFGGSSTDRANMALLPSKKHAEYAVFWNNLYYNLKGEQAQRNEA